MMLGEVRGGRARNPAGRHAPAGRQAGTSTARTRDADGAKVPQDQVVLRAASGQLVALGDEGGADCSRVGLDLHSA